MELEHIDTFVIVMMENRSFDHVCGYLPCRQRTIRRRLRGWANRQQIGLIVSITTTKNGKPISIHWLDPRVQNIIDLPHEDGNIRTQINTLDAVAMPPRPWAASSKAIWTQRRGPRILRRLWAGYDQAAVPVFDFFARNFAICDNWFSPLPAGTQINRLMGHERREPHPPERGPIHSNFPSKSLFTTGLRKFAINASHGAVISGTACRFLR